MSGVPIHLAIPSYNNAEGLRRLLTQATKQDFASITVLDDGSKDETTAVVQSFAGVRYVRTEENNGCVAAKNLILKALPETGWLLFIDSDMEIVTDDIPAKLEEFILNHEKAGAGVGLIRTESGLPMRFLKGYDLNPIRMILAGIFHTLHNLLLRDSLFQILVRKVSTLFVMDFDEIKEKKVDWAVEGFFFIRLELFKEFNGFDQAYIRNHEGPDLCLKLRQAGHQIWFFPEIELLDHDQHCHSTAYRRYHWWRSTFIYFLKHPSRLFVWGWPRP